VLRGVVLTALGLTLFSVIFAERAVRVGDAYVDVVPIWASSFGVDSLPGWDPVKHEAGRVITRHFAFVDYITFRKNQDVHR